MNQKLITVVVLVTISALSCTKEVVLEVPVSENFPVINSTFCAGDTICINVTESVSPFSGLPKIIDDAVVILFEDDNPADTLVYSDNGMYISDIIAKSGSVYRVEAFCKGHNTCYATDIVPELPVLSGVVFSDSALIDRDGCYISKAELTINAIGRESGYYEIKMYAHFIDFWNIEHVRNLYFSQINNTDPVILESGVSFLENSMLIFSDNLFANEMYNLPVYYQDYDNSWNDYYSDYELIVTVRAVSGIYYNYRHSYVLQNYDGNGLFSHSNNLSELPTSIYSNVENGFGIFAGYSEITDTFPKQ